MIRGYTFLTTMMVALFLSACTTSKVTTTPRSAVEMALMSGSAELALLGLRGGNLPAGTRFYLDASEFEAVDEEFVLSTLRLELLRQGLLAVEEEEDADVIVIPRTAISAIDESSSLIGIPELPVPIPGAGILQTPEIALFKRAKQIGLTRIGYYGINVEDSTLAFDRGTAAGETKYTRWTVLFLINFRTTNLSEPYRNRPSPLDEAPWISEAHLTPAPSQR